MEVHQTRSGSPGREADHEACAWCVPRVVCHLAAGGACQGKSQADSAVSVVRVRPLTGLEELSGEPGRYAGPVVDVYQSLGQPPGHCAQAHAQPAEGEQPAADDMAGADVAKWRRTVWE